MLLFAIMAYEDFEKRSILARLKKSMNCKKWLFSILLFSSVSIGFSQTGPAGVGSSSSIRFWYRADRTGTVLTNGQAVSTWSDLSGNSSNATGVNGPVFLQNGINGLPSVSFSGVGQYFNLGNLSSITGYWDPKE